MAYTPINWQTGDTITAEKLNRCDNGWSVESSSTTLCEETITTTSGGMGYNASLSYATPISADSLIVTFDGTEYTCTKSTAGSAVGYGGFTANGTDFSTYPFAIVVMSGTNYVYTESAGTYTIKIAMSSETVEVSDNFAKARGWSVESSSTTYINESVTTADRGDYAMGLTSYSNAIRDATLTITFNGTEYTCALGPMGYGAAADSTTPDFTTYPFGLATEGPVLLITETAGTYTLKVEGSSTTVETSTDFQSAVNSIVDTSMMPMECVSGTTTGQEMYDAYVAGRILFFKPYPTQLSMCFITGFDMESVVFIPTDQNISAGFTSDVFTVTTL